MMCMLPNIQVMGISLVLAFCNIELNKFVTQKLRIEIMNLSYHPLRLADVSDHAVAVHQLCPQLVLLVPHRHGSKLVGHPTIVEPVPSLWILHQPIDHPLKVLWSDRSHRPAWASSTASTPEQKRIKFSWQSKNIITSAPACTREVNSPAYSMWQHI
jgi:hypothetical protein